MISFLKIPLIKPSETIHFKISLQDSLRWHNPPPAVTLRINLFPFFKWTLNITNMALYLLAS
jgi:hypothetical protein